MNFIDWIKNAFSSFWTSIIGSGAAVAIIVNVIMLLTDGDANTMPDWGIVIPEFLVAIGLIAARDNNVTSEKAGASKEVAEAAK